MKKFCSLVLSIFFMLGCTAFAGCGEKSEPKPEPSAGRDNSMIKFDAWTKDDFLIGSWVAYGVDSDKTPSMSAQTKVLADSGINFITHGGWITDNGESVSRDMADESWWKHVDSVMKKNNILYTFAADPDGANTNKEVPVKGEASNMTDTAVEYATSIIPKLDNCIGIMVKDEPDIYGIPKVAQWAKKYAGIKQGVLPFVNLLPSYAGRTAIGSSYESYLESWVNEAGPENIDWLSHDYYPFEARGGTRETIYGDMEAMRKVGLKYDVKTHAFPQACAWSGMRMPNADELRWNVNAYLAYGFKGLSYFNYVMWQDEGCFDGIIDLHGNILHKDLYDALTDINIDIHCMNDMLMNSNCLHAYHTDDVGGCEKLPADALIVPELGDSYNNFIVSYMAARDKSEPHVMLFNKSWKKAVENQTFTVGANSGITELEYFNPQTRLYESVPVKNGKFTLSFLAGEGKFLRLKGDVTMK